jgi:hypothetical protein
MFIYADPESNIMKAEGEAAPPGKTRLSVSDSETPPAFKPGRFFLTRLVPKKKIAQEVRRFSSSVFC